MHLLFNARHISTSIRRCVRADVPALIDVEASSCTRCIENFYGYIFRAASIREGCLIHYGWVVIRTSDIHQVGYVGLRTCRVFDGERGRRAAAVAAVIRHCKGHRCGARCSTAITQGVEVVAPSNATAGIRCHRTTIAGKPCIEVSCVACTVAFNRSIHRFDIHRWVRFVFDGERSGCATAVAAVVRRSEGHGRHARSTAVVAQRVEVVAPGHSAARIRCYRTAIAGDPCVEIRCVAGAVALNQRVGCLHFHYWSEVINNLNQLIAGCRCCISAVVRDRYRERSREAERAFAIRRNRTVGNHEFRHQASVAVIRSFNVNGTQCFNRSIHTAVGVGCQIRVSWTGQRKHWYFVVHQCNGLNKRAGVATVVHRRVGTDVRTDWGYTSRIAFCIFKRHEHIAAVIGGRRIQREIWPVSTTHFYAFLSREHRRCLIDNRDGLRSVGCVTAIIRRCKGTNNRVSIWAGIIQDDFFNQTDRHIATSILCGRILIHQLLFTRNRVIGWHISESWGRCVFDGERSRRAAAVAAGIRRYEHDRRCTCQTAIVTKRIEVV